MWFDGAVFPLFELLRFRIEYRDLLSAEVILSKPNLIVCGDVLAPRAGRGSGRRIQRDLSGGRIYFSDVAIEGFRVGWLNVAPLS
jgi:hypothetical protein